MPAKISLTHLALHVRDFAANVAFSERFCGLHCIHRRGEPGMGPEVAWLAEPGKEHEFILVFISGGPTRGALGNDFAPVVPHQVGRFSASDIAGVTNVCVFP